MCISSALVCARPLIALEPIIEKLEVLTRKVVIDRSKFPTADNEYTPTQRRAIDALLAKSETDLKKGRTHGPFETADEAIAFLRQRRKVIAKTKAAMVNSAQ
jgi:hypothetical protein